MVRYLTLSVVFTGNIASGSNTVPDFSRISGFLMYPHPPLALNIPCITHNDLPCPFTRISHFKNLICSVIDNGTR